MRGFRATLVVDLIGALLLGAFAAIGGWYAAGSPSDAKAQLQEGLRSAASLEENVATLREELSAAQQQLAEVRETYTARGSLPQNSPVERDLTTITELARSCRLRVADVSPAGAVDYPGVREQRYSLGAEGGFADWLLFLGRFESCSFWADITYLQMNQAASRTETAAVGDVVSPEQRPSVPSAALTLSFYSAAAEQPDGKEADTKTAP